MPYISMKHITKTRILISGLPQSGKTTSLPTFIYGPYDYYDEQEQQAAIDYADGKHAVIIVCPGEFGIKSLPQDTPHLTSLYYETGEGEDTNSVKWSESALSGFFTTYKDTIKGKPDILILDGIHCLWSHWMNRTTGGDFLSGIDMSVNPATGRVDKYRPANFYSRTHQAFGQFIAGVYSEQVPLIICTTWEALEPDSAGDIGSTRHLLPAIPGEMAYGIIGRFDARVSARVEKRCCHTGCEQSKKSEEHYVWQFVDKDKVKGLGIKGIKRYTSLMKQHPYVHQNWQDLKRLIEVCS